MNSIPFSHDPADRIAARRIVSRHKAQFTGPPKQVPSFKSVDGPITGNGDIGLTVSGPPESQRYWISKNDFWKSGPDFKQCGPSLIGGIDVRIGDLQDGSYHIEQILYDAVIRSDFAAADHAVTLEARVMATDNVIVLEMAASNRPVPVELELWVKDGYGSTTERQQDGDVFLVTRKFNADNLLYPTEAAIAMRTLEHGGTGFILEPGKPVTVVACVMTNHESVLPLTAGSPVESDSGKPLTRSGLRRPDLSPKGRSKVPPSPLGGAASVRKLRRAKEGRGEGILLTSDAYALLARDKVKGLTTSDLQRLKAEHDEWWQAFWAASFVELEDSLLEKHYYASLYIMACCSRNENFPPGLYGNWITMDRTAWAGDIHLNYNHEAPFWALYSSNRVQLTDSYDTPLLDHLPEFESDAKRCLNKKGAYASVGIGPKGLTSRFFDREGMDKVYGAKCDTRSCQDLIGAPMFLGQKSNAVFAAMNMILRYRYTYDEGYVRKVYPYLRSVATFWEDYLVFEDGRYVIYDDSYHEVGPWQGNGWEKGYGDFNPILSLGMLRVLFKAMIDISQDLDRDAQKRDTWQHILTHLSDFPVHAEDGRKRFRACEGGHGSARDLIGLDRIMLYGLVYPATNIGLSSEPTCLRMVRDDMQQWDDAVWLGDFHTVFIGAARVGYAPDFLMAKAREKIMKHAYPNLWIPTDGGGIETCSAIPGMINEMMLQSHGDVIRVFPVFPRNQKASFRRLRTFGAFLVSGAIESGQVQYVAIESEKGRVCNIVNPWPDKQVGVVRNGGEAEVMSGAVLSFSTESGEQLLLTEKKTLDT